jgi:hypothetical protein
MKDLLFTSSYAGEPDRQLSCAIFIIPLSDKINQLMQGGIFAIIQKHTHISTINITGSNGRNTGLQGAARRMGVYPGSGSFAYPYGEYNPTIITALKTHDEESRDKNPPSPLMAERSNTVWMNRTVRQISRRRDLNPRPADYESAAIPLSHGGTYPLLGRRFILLTFVSERDADQEYPLIVVTLSTGDFSAGGSILPNLAS